jgi:putative transposase
MQLLAARPPFVPLRRAADALGLTRNQCYPDRRRRRKQGPRRAHPRALSQSERSAVLDTLHSPEHADQAPRQVYARLLTEGTVLASVSTMYRLLRAAGETAERRPQRPPQRHAVPRLQARAPHQVWTWDITRLPTLTRGVFLFLYVILDLYSRHVVGWMVSRKENAGLAKHLFGHTLKRHQIAPDQLIVHQDRGAPMTAHCFTDLLSDLGVESSYSRPRVSNDNAAAEACFKTVKYAPNYPGRFVDADHARRWLSEFFAHYDDRPHQGLNLFTPADLFNGRVEATLACRQAALDAHYQRHPERYPNGAPKVKPPPAVVYINPADGVSITAQKALEQPGTFKLAQPPVETDHEVVTQK